MNISIQRWCVHHIFKMNAPLVIGGKHDKKWEICFEIASHEGISDC